MFNHNTITNAQDVVHKLLPDIMDLPEDEFCIVAFGIIDAWTGRHCDSKEEAFVITRAIMKATEEMIKEENLWLEN